MNSGQVARIDENDKPVSSDEALKESTSARAATPAQPAQQRRDPGTGRESAEGRAAALRVNTCRVPAASCRLLALIGSLSLAGGFGVRLARRAF
jgi:hypothetical protein